MRDIIKNYVFDKVNKTITFSDYSSIDLKSILLVVDVTNGKTIYQPNNASKLGTVLTNVLTLIFNTNTVEFNNSDVLQIFYDESPAGNNNQAIPSSSILIGGRNVSGSLTPISVTTDGYANSNSQITLSGSLNVNGAILGPIDCSELSSLFLRIHSNGAAINLTYNVEQCDLADFSSNVFTCAGNPNLQSTNTTLGTSAIVQTSTIAVAAPTIMQLSVIARFVRLRISAYTSGTLVSVFKGYRNSNLPQAINIASQPAISIAATQTLATVTTVATVTNLTNIGAPSTNADVTSAARTTSGNSGTIADVAGGISISAVLNVTAVSGTAPTLDVILEESYDNGTTWVAIYHFIRITTIAVNVRSIAPIPLGGRRRWTWNIGGTTPSFIFSITVMRANAFFPIRKQFFIRDSGILSASLDSTSSGFRIEGCKTLGVIFNSLSATQTGSYKLQYSMDAEPNSWYDVSPEFGVPQNSSSYLSNNNNTLGNFARIICSKSGSGHTLSYASIVATQ